MLQEAPISAHVDGPTPGSTNAVADHLRVARWNRHRLVPGEPCPDWTVELADEFAMRRIESRLVETLRLEVQQPALEAPDDARGFVLWFEDLKQTGPGQGDPLFPWLAEEADLLAMKWFLTQEAAGEAGFDDLVAMAQVKMPETAKLELARNYWDEMGRGNPKGMHGKMLADLVSALALQPSIETTVLPSLALANVMTALATTRRYAWHAIGALGVIELTAPGRSTDVAAGLKRLGVKPAHRHYFDLHAVLDVRHSEAWNREVLQTLVAENPTRARWIAEGALMRLECGARCFRAYREALWRPEHKGRIADSGLRPGVFKMPDRELIDTGTDKRFVRRDESGRFKESDDVGRSLAADRRTKAKAKTKSGQGDRGDRKPS